MRQELVLDALEMANGLRHPDENLIAHSDRGAVLQVFKAHTGFEPVPPP